MEGSGLYGIGAGSNVDIVGNAITGTAAQFAIQASSGRVVDNLVYGNANGITATGLVAGNRVYGTGTSNASGVGIDARSGAVVRANTVYGQSIGIRVATGSGADVVNNVVYGNATAGITVDASLNTDILNNTVYQLAGSAIFLTGNTSGTVLTNNIIVALNALGIVVANSAQGGFASGFNIFQVGPGGQAGQWQGSNRQSLAAWRLASQQDATSIDTDPLFIDPDGADNVLGYASASADGRDDDFHVQSGNGSFAGGHLSVVRDLVTGLPVRLATPVAVPQGGNSPAVDRGSPATPVGAEQQPNGGFVEVGAYGGTAQASLSPERYIRVFGPNGGETFQQGRTVSVDWRSSGINAATVDVEVSRDGITWISLEDDGANDGHLDWVVAPGTFVPGSYQLRVTTSDGLLSDTSDTPFTVTLPIRIYYVDDASNTNDEYTPDSIGNDANDGLSALTPKASIQALLAQYDLGAGDIILVDTGSYASTTTIVITADDGGTSDTGRLIIRARPMRPARRSSIAATCRAARM